MIKPLTSLRFFFALMVFTSHFFFLKISDPTLTSLYENIFKEGFLGVSFFFILSGFVLALNYKEKLLGKSITAKDFMVARIARIYPLHVVTLLLSIPLAYKAFQTDIFSTLGKFVVNLLLLQSFVPVRDIYFSFNIPSWSISNEFFFYLLFPVIISLFFKIRKSERISLFILLLIPLGIFLCPEKIEHRFFYVNPFYRIADFVIGILLYNIYEKGLLSKQFRSASRATAFEFFSIGLFIASLFFHARVPIGYRYSCYYWLPMSAIILAFSYQAGFLSKVLSNKSLVFFGEISYSFYLLHFLVIQYLMGINSHLNIINNDYLLVSTVFCITMIGSFISFRFIEQPSSRFIKKKYKQISLRVRELPGIDIRAHKL